MDSTRAQSDLIGYVIVFSAIIVATSTVAMFGLTALEEVQSATVNDNGEFVMQSVAADVETLFYRSARTRTTEISLGSASLETAAPTAVSVSIKEVTGGSVGPTIETVGPYEYRPIVYSTPDVDIAYTNSLVVRDQQRGEVAVTQSLFSLSNGHSLIPVVETVPTRVQSVGGEGTVRLAAARSGSESITESNGPDTVHVEVTIDSSDPERATVFGRVLNEELAGVNTPHRSGPACQKDPSDATLLTCQFDTDSVVVSRVVIQYEMG